MDDTATNELEDRLLLCDVVPIQKYRGKRHRRRASFPGTSNDTQDKLLDLQKENYELKLLYNNSINSSIEKSKECELLEEEVERLQNEENEEIKQLKEELDDLKEDYEDVKERLDNHLVEIDLDEYNLDENEAAILIGERDRAEMLLDEALDEKDKHVEGYETRIRNLMDAFDDRIKKVESDYQAKLERKQERFDTKIQKLKSDNKTNLETKQSEFDRKISEFKDRIEKLKSSYEAKLETKQALFDRKVSEYCSVVDELATSCNDLKSKMLSKCSGGSNGYSITDSPLQDMENGITSSSQNNGTLLSEADELPLSGSFPTWNDDGTDADNEADKENVDHSVTTGDSVATQKSSAKNNPPLAAAAAAMDNNGTTNTTENVDQVASTCNGFNSVTEYLDPMTQGFNHKIRSVKNAKTGRFDYMCPFGCGKAIVALETDTELNFNDPKGLSKYEKAPKKCREHHFSCRKDIYYFEAYTNGQIQYKEILEEVLKPDPKYGEVLVQTPATRSKLCKKSPHIDTINESKKVPFENKDAWNRFLAPLVAPFMCKNT